MLALASQGKRSTRPMIALIAAALLVVSACAGTSSTSGPGGESENKFPSGPIQLVVPYPAGGGTDTTARAVAPFLEEELGTPVNVVIRSGGAGTAGALYVRRQNADGTTILMGESGVMTTGPLANPNTPYDPGKDFVGVAQLTSNPWLLVASRKSGLTSMQEFVDQSRANPQNIEAGIAGVLSSDHYALLLLQRELDFPQYGTVAYGGGGPKSRALLAGEVDVIMDTYEGIRAGLQDDKAVPLAVLADKRLDKLSDVPTTIELGYEPAVASLWQGMMVKTGTPEHVVKRLQEAVRSVTQNKDWRERVKKIGLTPAFLGTNDFNKKMRQERNNAKEVISKIDKSRIQQEGASQS